MSATSQQPAGAYAGYVSAPTTDLAALVEEFNRILKRLTCGLAAKYPADPAIDRARKRMTLATDVSPESIIDAVGPYLYAYRKQVYEGFSTKNDYIAELQKTVSAEKAGPASDIILKVAEAWGASATPEERAYRELVQSLLDVYLEYLALKVEPR